MHSDTQRNPEQPTLAQALPAPGITDIGETSATSDVEENHAAKESSNGGKNTCKQLCARLQVRGATKAHELFMLLWLLPFVFLCTSLHQALWDHSRSQYHDRFVNYGTTATLADWYVLWRAGAMPRHAPDENRSELVALRQERPRSRVFFVDPSVFAALGILNYTVQENWCAWIERCLEGVRAGSNEALQNISHGVEKLINMNASTAIISPIVVRYTFIANGEQEHAKKFECYLTSKDPSQYMFGAVPFEFQNRDAAQKGFDKFTDKSGWEITKPAFDVKAKPEYNGCSLKTVVLLMQNTTLKKVHLSKFLKSLPIPKQDFPFVVVRPRSLRNRPSAKAPFKVDVHKLRMAFYWLKQNNPYYHDVEWDDG